MKHWIFIFAMMVLLAGQAKAGTKVGAGGKIAPEVKLQILLDRAGFSPGQIDGKVGSNFGKAVSAFQEAHGLSVTGFTDQPTLDALGDAQLANPLVPYTISQQDAAGPFAQDIPHELMEQAKLPRLNYTSVIEELGEKFHCSPDLLKQINPQSQFGAGESILVPNIAVQDPAAVQKVSQSSKPKVTKLASVIGGFDDNPAQDVTIVVDGNDSDVTVRDASGKLIFFAPATVGSSHDPLPVGTWKVTGIHKTPWFYYHPELFWDADPADSKVKIAPGPNNPVGMVWIGTNAPHYGIHGSPEPSLIGHSESHGCIRLTNWDALRLASLVQEGTRIIFE